MKGAFVNYIPGDVHLLAKEIGIEPSELIVHVINYLLGQYPADGQYELEAFLTNYEDCLPLININDALNAGVPKAEPADDSDDTMTRVQKNMDALCTDLLDPIDREGYDHELDLDWRGPIFNMLEATAASMNGMIELAVTHFERFQWRVMADDRSYIVYYNTNGIRAETGEVDRLLTAFYDLES